MLNAEYTHYLKAYERPQKPSFLSSYAWTENSPALGGGCPFKYGWDMKYDPAWVIDP